MHCLSFFAATERKKNIFESTTLHRPSFFAAREGKKEKSVPVLNSLTTLHYTTSLFPSLQRGKELSFFAARERTFFLCSEGKKERKVSNRFTLPLSFFAARERIFLSLQRGNEIKFSSNPPQHRRVCIFSLSMFKNSPSISKH